MIFSYSSGVISPSARRLFAISEGLAGELNGFRLVEATEAQLRNLMVETIPEIQFSYVPIFDFPKVAKTYIEVNK